MAQTAQQKANVVKLNKIRSGELSSRSKASAKASSGTSGGSTIKAPMDIKTPTGTPVNELNKTTGKYQKIGGGDFVRASSTGTDKQDFRDVLGIPKEKAEQPKVFGPESQAIQGYDYEARNKAIVSELANTGQKAEDYLKSQKGYLEASPEDQKATLDKITKMQEEASYKSPDEMQAEIGAKEAIDLVTKTQEDIQFAKDQQEKQNKIDNLQAESAGIARSETLEKSANQLEALKQSVAYLGSGGQPGVSSVHLNAISKQIDAAQTTYDRIVKMKQNEAAVEAIGREFSEDAFAKSIADAQYQLDQQVNTATQAVINEFMAKGEKIDTMEELHQVEIAMMAQLDKSISNIAISNQADRKKIIDMYNAKITQGEEFTKNKNIVNEAVSKAQGIYIDGNGNPMVTPSGEVIKYKPEYQTSFDQTTGILTSRDPSDPAGTLTQKQIGKAGGGKIVNVTIDGVSQSVMQMPDGTLKPISIEGKSDTGYQQQDLGEIPVDTGIKNVYGSNVKLAPTVGDKLKTVVNQLQSQGITLQIGDSTRSHAVQQAAYDKRVAGGKVGPQIAEPGLSFHEKGQAIDIAQNQMNDPVIEKALLDAGFTRPVASERFHRSIGEGSDKFTTQGGGKTYNQSNSSMFEEYAKNNKALGTTEQERKASLKSMGYNSLPEFTKDFKEWGKEQVTKPEPGLITALNHIANNPLFDYTDEAGKKHKGMLGKQGVIDATMLSKIEGNLNQGLPRTNGLILSPLLNAGDFAKIGEFVSALQTVRSSKVIDIVKGGEVKLYPMSDADIGLLANSAGLQLNAFDTRAKDTMKALNNMLKAYQGGNNDSEGNNGGTRADFDL